MAKGNKRPRAGAAPVNSRHPKQGATVTAKKRPIPAEPGPDDDPHLVFRLQLLDAGGPWGWAEMSSAHMRTITAKCKGWESMRQSELFGNGGNKLIPIDNLCSQAQSRLQTIELDDLDGLWELRLSGAKRIWGHREGHIFYIIWWDPDHQVCPSAKK